MKTSIRRTACMAVLVASAAGVAAVGRSGAGRNDLPDHRCCLIRHRVMHTRFPERIAWSLVALLTVFWLWFGLASAIAEDLGWENLLYELMIPGGWFAIIGAVAWRWRLAGAVLLVATGLVILIGYPIVFSEFFPTSTVVLVLLTMAVPPITAGVLLIETRRIAHL